MSCIFLVNDFSSVNSGDEKRFIIITHIYCYAVEYILCCAAAFWVGRTAFKVLSVAGKQRVSRVRSRSRAEVLLSGSSPRLYRQQRYLIFW